MKQDHVSTKLRNFFTFGKINNTSPVNTLYVVDRKPCVSLKGIFKDPIESIHYMS